MDLNSFAQTAAGIGNITNAATNAVNTFTSGGSLADSLLSGTGLTAGAEAVGDIVSAVASFSDSTNPADWRVRLSLANWTSFKGSPVLKPLKDAGGLIFPYTPTINLSLIHI